MCASNNNLKLTSKKQKKGENYEERAYRFLVSQGLHLVARNWLIPKTGELDLVMIEKGQAWDVLVFVEVRVRSLKGYGDALTSVTKAKQNKLTKTAQYFLQHHPEYDNYECRFDVVGFVENMQTQQIDWVRGAFLTNAW